MALYDLLACPSCRADIAPRTPESLACTHCLRIFPIVHGVPVLLPDGRDYQEHHEGALPVRPGYARWKERIVLKSLTDAQVALDFGAGHQDLDDPCIIRMDVTWNPRVDVVGDVQALPFRDGCLDFAFGGAVMEHLPDPDRAAAELHRVLKPGGYVYADWNFLLAYHGYPHHYFNATIHGIREVFAPYFTLVDSGVAPHQGPAFALRSLLGTYLAHFPAGTRLEQQFAAHLHRALWYPLDDFDRRIPEADRFRMASGVYLFGVKQPCGHETIIPDAVMGLYRESPELQRRFPNPLDLSVPDNLMLWAKTASATHQGLRHWFESLQRFSKYADPGRSWDRSTVEAWPLELYDRPDPLPGEEDRRAALEGGWSIGARLLSVWRRHGWRAVARRIGTGLQRRANDLRRRWGHR